MTCTTDDKTDLADRLIQPSTGYFHDIGKDTRFYGNLVSFLKKFDITGYSRASKCPDDLHKKRAVHSCSLYPCEHSMPQCDHPGLWLSGNQNPSVITYHLYPFGNDTAKDISVWAEENGFDVSFFGWSYYPHESVIMVTVEET